MKKLIRYQVEKKISSLVESDALEKMDEVDIVEEHTGQENKKGTDVVAILDKHDKSFQSPISKLARRVGELTWYKHLLLFAVVVAVAAIVGVILQAVLIWTIAVALLYVVIIGFLKHHHRCEERRVKTNIEMAAYAEEKLKGGIEDVKDVGHDLDALSSGLTDASRIMEEAGKSFATQNEKQEEQTLATNALNLSIFQTHSALEESRQALDKTHGDIEVVSTRLADNLSHLSEVGESITASSLAIEQAASDSKAIHEGLAKNVNALDVMVGTLKENASTGSLLLDQVRESTIELAETMKETAKSRARLNATLEVSTGLIQSSEALIEGFAENRQQAIDDRRRYEKTIKDIEKNERAFQNELARLMTDENLMHNSTQSVYMR